MVVTTKSSNNSAAQNLIERSWATADNAEKITLLEKALEYDPNSLVARAELAYSIAGLAEFGSSTSAELIARAKDEALTVLASDPNNGLTNLALARTYLLQDADPPSALEAFNRAAAVGSHPSLIAIYKAAIYLNTGHYDLAETTMREVYTAADNDPWVEEFYARCLYFNGNFEMSEQLFDKALVSDPRNSNAIIFSIMLAASAGDVDRMELLLKKIPQDAILPLLAELPSALRGNTQPLRKLISFYEDNRSKYDLAATVYTYAHWWAKDYEAHIRWFKIREQELNNLYFTNFDIYVMTNYWETLETWAFENPEDQVKRTQILDEHKARIAHITAKMVL